MSRISLADLVRHQKGPSHLTEVPAFGVNPGRLGMFVHIPPRLPPGAGLVVALHGCTQDARRYDRGSGWSSVADQGGFAVLFPEQRDANNPQGCFNWFQPENTRRGGGEIASIRAMVAHMVAEHRIDPARVFVTGLSAGGAMASALLACHPEVFAAGAIIAGLPFGAASTMPEAFEAMATARPRAPEAWAELVRGASTHRGPWPRVAVWQGAADHTVSPANATQIAAQWVALHQASPIPEGLAWQDASGRVVVEQRMVPGLGHGVPIDPARAGEPGPFFLPSGISSSHEIAGFFGLPVATAPAGVILVGRDGSARPGAARRAASEPAPAAETGGGFSPGEVIRRALAAAGLMRR